MYSILLLMLATVGLSIFAEDNSQRSDSDDAYSAVRHAQHAWLMSNLERNRLIHSLNGNIYGCPTDKK